MLCVRADSLCGDHERETVDASPLSRAMTGGLASRDGWVAMEYGLVDVLCGCLRFTPSQGPEGQEILASSKSGTGKRLATMWRPGEQHGNLRVLQEDCVKTACHVGRAVLIHGVPR